MCQPLHPSLSRQPWFLGVVAAALVLLSATSAHAVRPYNDRVHRLHAAPLAHANSMAFTNRPLFHVKRGSSGLIQHGGPVNSYHPQPWHLGTLRQR